MLDLGPRGRVTTAPLCGRTATHQDSSLCRTEKTARSTIRLYCLQSNAFYAYITITGPVGTHFRTARCPRPSKPRVPSTAASGTAQPCRLDGSFVTRRRKGPVKVRGKTRKAFKHSRYMRLPLLVDPRSSASAADKVDQMSGELCLPAIAHLIFTSGKHIFELEPSM